ncbi:MAG: fimbrillin family protein, partial [Bacteroidetes bacterium]|nr:fimbrillin family protein [Bacteroidota bacterium]
MKKNLFFASFLMAMGIFTSCSKNETLSVNQVPNEISIRAYTSSPTKADIINTTNLKKFVVFGYQTETDYEGVGVLGTPYIDALAVTRKDDSENWSYDNNYYWPIDGKKIQTFAFSPKDELVSDYLTSETDYPSFKYIVGEAGSTQKDLVVSSLLNLVKPEKN